MGMQQKEHFARSKVGTSQTMRALGYMTAHNPKWLQVPPARAEALYRGIFNAWADHSLRLMDDVLFPKQTPARYLDEQMVFKAFTERAGKQNRYISKFYDLTAQMSRIYNTVNEMEDSDSTIQQRIAGEIMDDPTKALMYDLQPEVRAALKYVREERKAINAIRTDPDMSPEEKRDTINELRIELNEYMEDTWKDWASEIWPKGG
jgi:hypothetical protein